MTPPRLIEVELRVRDLERSLAFYRALLGDAIGEPETHGPGDALHVHATWGSWSKQDDGFLMLNLYPADAGEQSRSRISLAVDDVAALHERLVVAGVAVERAPERKPWGLSATYRDPDGNVVAIIERPRSASRAGGAP